MAQHNPGFADHTGKPAATAGITRSNDTVHRRSRSRASGRGRARARVGHHWVPQGVFKPLKDRMTQDAFDIFMAGTESTGVYNHAFDPWDGVKHREYSEAMAELLKDWITKNGGSSARTVRRTFLSWVANGECKDAEFLAKHKALFDTVFKWRAGFNQSIVIAARAAEINPNLTPAELKSIAQQVVNGAPTKPLSKAATKALQGIAEGGKAALEGNRQESPPRPHVSQRRHGRQAWLGGRRQSRKRGVGSGQ